LGGGKVDEKFPGSDNIRAVREEKDKGAQKVSHREVRAKGEKLPM